MARKIAPERLVRAMSTAGLDQQTIARELGASPQAVSSWVTGLIGPRAARLVALAQLLQVTPDWLCGNGADEMPAVAPPRSNGNGAHRDPRGTVLERAWAISDELAAELPSIPPTAIHKIVEALVEAHLAHERRATAHRVSAPARLAEPTAKRERSSARREPPAGVRPVALPLPRTPLDRVGVERAAAVQPTWGPLAAGEGLELERVAGEFIAPEFATSTGIHLAEVHGESMEPTLCHGDIAVLQVLDPPLRLVDNPVARSPVATFRAVVSQDSLVVVAVNDAAPTLKRVQYDVSSKGTWFMRLVADNAEWGDRHEYPRVIRLQDSVAVYATVLAIAVPSFPHEIRD